jgi:hypothetical protein
MDLKTRPTRAFRVALGVPQRVRGKPRILASARATREYGAAERPRRLVALLTLACAAICRRYLAAL